jgi:hypothetical protein
VPPGVVIGGPDQDAGREPSPCCRPAPRRRRSRGHQGRTEVTPTGQSPAGVGDRPVLVEPPSPPGGRRGPLAGIPKTHADGHREDQAEASCRGRDQTTCTPSGTGCTERTSRTLPTSSTRTSLSVRTDWPSKTDPARKMRTRPWWSRGGPRAIDLRPSDSAPAAAGVTQRLPTIDGERKHVPLADRDELGPGCRNRDSARRLQGASHEGSGGWVPRGSLAGRG